ncbi:LolA family protein [Halonotius sp. GCM10025705]|uniref:LolA family protein n=1 Tax=Halonotius sp. GCM10025705 TaxID=3252678 RepID=UPI00360EC7FE
MTSTPFSRRLGVLAALLVVGLLAAGAATGLPGMAVDDQPSGDEILDRVETRYDSADTLSGTATVTVENATASSTATVSFAAKQPEKVAYTVEKAGITYEAGSNGSVAWAVGENRSYAREIPTEAELEAYEASGDRERLPGEASQYGSLTDPVAASNVTATLVETTEIDGESAYVVDIEPTDDAATVAGTLWVATDDSRLLQATATDGTNETTVRVSETQFNVSIHDSTFEPPADRVSVTTTDTYDSFAAVQSATELSVPPSDAGTFTTATVISRANGQAVVQQYAVDNDTVSVITASGVSMPFDQLDNETTVAVDGRSATAVERDDRAVVFWTADGVTTAVAVEGTIEEATAAAAEL